MSGFLCIMKPPGMTSNDVVMRIRRQIKGKEKVGHAGTLDPEASGVLPLMIGKASRLFDYLVEKEKVYIAQLKPGYSTDTQDAHGKIVEGEGKKASYSLLEKTIPQFVGKIDQIPPMYSALKRDGQKLCDLARRGIEIELNSRPTEIHEIKILHALNDGSFLIYIRCGKGTYIRTLCHDIGTAMGTKAHMGMLIRAKSGFFTLDNAHTIEEVEHTADLKDLMISMDAPLNHLPRIDVADTADHLVKNGNALPRKLLSCEYEQGVSARLYIHDQFAGIGKMQGNVFKFDAMLLE